MKSTKFKILFFALLSMSLYCFAQFKDDCDLGDPKPLPIPIPQPGLGDANSMIMQRAVDPNELTGPLGVDSVRWVSNNDELSYTVFFENDPSFATAHAQIVDISIDVPDVRLLNDFKLGAYTFANRSYEIPNEPNFYSMRLDCRDSLDIYVDVLAGMDIENKKTYWRLSSIDPESGHAPWEVDRGLLPVNDSTHVGEGFVTFRIKPYEELVTGDTISFFANIVFDSNDTIPTNRWCNRIDAGAPTSRVIANADQENYSHYRLSFNAEDDKNGSGIDKVLLYLADNLGNYEEYASCPVDSILDFYVEKGKQYYFMSIAVDRVGNREDLKFEPDITLNFNEPPTDLLLSNSVFQDDIEHDGFIGELSTIDTDGETEFTYALAEGEGAIHNDMFSVVGNRLQANDCFKCSDISRYNIRLSTTDAGGLTYSKPFTLDMRRVLEEPEPQTVIVEICEGDTYDFHGETYRSTGSYTVRVQNEFMCDSVYTLNLRVNPIPDPPTITVSGKSTLISSAERGNQWYFNGDPIDGATEQEYTATQTGLYSVTSSNGNCESNPSDEYLVNLNATEEMMINLQRGWNWFSSNTDDDYIKRPDQFFNSVMENVQQVYGASGILENSDGLLQGSLTSIEPATYKIRMSNSDQISINAGRIEPETYPVTMSPGWTWIPYIPAVDLSIEMALANLTPKENDVIKSKTQFATYANGRWNGPLKELHPNSGYLYHTDRAVTFTYSPARVNAASKTINQDYPEYQWTFDDSDYPDNMTIVARLYDGEVETIDGVYSVGAFCDEECRGAGVYENGLLYITVHGNNGHNITFKAIENATEEERGINESLTFNEDPVGTLQNPLRLSLGLDNGIADVTLSSDNLNIYPNPVRDIMYIEGDLTDVNVIKVISTEGLIILSTKDFKHGINVSSIPDGVYVAAILTSGGTVYRKFMKKGY